MVEVSMAVQEDFHVSKFESQLLNIRFDLRRRLREAAVEENVAGRSDNQKRSHVRSADIINISNDVKRGDGLIHASHFRVSLWTRGRGQEDENRGGEGRANPQVRIVQAGPLHFCASFFTAWRTASRPKRLTIPLSKARSGSSHFMRFAIFASLVTR